MLRRKWGTGVVPEGLGIDMKEHKVRVNGMKPAAIKPQKGKRGRRRRAGGGEQEAGAREEEQEADCEAGETKVGEKEVVGLQ